MKTGEEIILNTLRSDDENRILLSDSGTLIEMECYRILEEIKKIIRDDDLSDKECFYRIEKLVCLFESNGIDSGSRHDF